MHIPEQSLVPDRWTTKCGGEVYYNTLASSWSLQQVHTSDYITLLKIVFSNSLSQVNGITKVKEDSAFWLTKEKTRCYWHQRKSSKHYNIAEVNKIVIPCSVSDLYITSISITKNDH